MPEIVKLGHIVERTTGTRNPTRAPDSNFIYVDVAAVDNAEKRIVGARSILGSEAPSRARQVIRTDDILVSTVRPNLNAVALVPAALDDQVASTGFCVLRASAKVLPEYLFFFVRSCKFVDGLSSLVAGAMYPAVSDSQVLDQSLPLPPLPEQRRIVDLLSRADGIVRLRREAEKKASELIPALFLDMFGDPATNPRGWPVAPTGELVKLTNGRAFKPAEWCKEGTPIIRIQNLNDPEKPFNYYEGELPEKYKVRSGDILLSWSGTPGTSFGCFRWKRQDGWLNQHIFRVEVDHGVDEEFFIHQINLRLPELIDRAHGGVGLQHFTKGELESLPFIIPPPHAQQHFRDQAEQALSIHDQQMAATTKAQAAFDALLARTFAG